MVPSTALSVTIAIVLTFKQGQSFSIAVSSMHQNALESKGDDPLLTRLRQLTEGLLFISEADYPLESVNFPSPLTNERLIEFAQPDSPTGTDVKQLSLNELLRYHTSEKEGKMYGDLALARQFQALESFMNQELQDTHVYRIGSETRIVILALGTTNDRTRLVGFRTIPIET